jgi:adenylosuccinate lyase
MSGAGLLSEGFKEGQVGSSAMPHKVNARSSERINGLAVVLKGYLSMMSEVSGDQWNEGDVSCSVVRRVALPDAFFAMDAILQTTATILNEIEVFEEVITQEVEANLPFVATTKLLVAAVTAGMGREDAHQKIQRVSLDALKKHREGKQFDLLSALAGEEDFPLMASDIENVFVEVKKDCIATNQMSSVQKRILSVTNLSGETRSAFEEII